MIKNYLTILFFLLINICYSQIKKIELPDRVEIGKIAPGGIMSMKCEKENDKYIFSYKDQKFSRLDEWKKFTLNSTEDFETIYQYIEKGFEEMPKKPLVLDISNGFLVLYYDKFLGAKVLRFAHSTSDTENAIVGFTNQYTQKQVKKLFNKEK